ncbi:MAG: hypothetical protein WAT09_09990 [Paracoccaceae bacterium]
MKPTFVIARLVADLVAMDGAMVKSGDLIARPGDAQATFDQTQRLVTSGTSHAAGVVLAEAEVTLKFDRARLASDQLTQLWGRARRLFP